MLAKRVRQGDQKARERMIAGNAGFAYKKALKISDIHANRSRVDEEDIISSALMGLIDAVDRFDPDYGYAFTTYAHFWIIKRINESIESSHWGTMRPPRELVRRVIYRGDVSDDDTTQYSARYYGGTSSDDELSESFHVCDDDDAIMYSRICRAAAESGLTPEETDAFFQIASGDTSAADTLAGSAALEKVRKELGE